MEFRNARKEVTASDIIKLLDRMQAQNKNQVIIIETPGNTISISLSNAIIYEGHRGEIVFDIE